MSILTIGLLKQIIDKLPDDYEVEYATENTIVPVERIEIDVGSKRIILK